MTVEPFPVPGEAVRYQTAGLLQHTYRWMRAASEVTPTVAWLTQRRAGGRWAHRGHSAVRAACVRWVAAPVAVVAAASAVGAAIPPESVIGGRARFGLLIRCLMRLGARPATSSRDGSWFGVAGSASHGDMTIDSVAATDAEELTPEGFDVFVQHPRRWNGRPGQLHRRQVTSL
jgi:hypothetical protein